MENKICVGTYNPCSIMTDKLTRTWNSISTTNAIKDDYIDSYRTAAELFNKYNSIDSYRTTAELFNKFEEYQKNKKEGNNMEEILNIYRENKIKELEYKHEKNIEKVNKESELQKIANKLQKQAEKELEKTNINYKEYEYCLINVSFYDTKEMKEEKDNLSKFGYSKTDVEVFISNLQLFLDFEKENEKRSVKNKNPYFIIIQKELVDMLIKKKLIMMKNLFNLKNNKKN